MRIAGWWKARRAVCRADAGLPCFLNQRRRIICIDIRPTRTFIRVSDVNGVFSVQESIANACALAEMWFDRTNTVRNLVTVTVSEGIGTGIIADGRLVRGANGMAGDLRSFSTGCRRPQCGCGKRGCWEVLGSDKAALRYYFECVGRASRTRAADLEFKGLLSMADQGDILAIKALDKMAAQLARGVRMIIAGLDPEGTLFVGEFTSAWGRFEPRIKAEIEQQKISSLPVALVPARDGELTRLRGTVALVLYKHFGISLPGGIGRTNFVPEPLKWHARRRKRPA